MGSSKFVTVEIGLGMLLYFSPLHGQLAKMLIPLDVVGVVHKEDKKISLDVQQYLAAELKLHRFLRIDTVDLNCMSLFCWGLVVDDLFLFWIAYCSHCYLISITSAVQLKIRGNFIGGFELKSRVEGRECFGIIFIFKIYQMNNNNNGSALMLAWVNRERALQGQTIILYDFQHLKSTGFVYQLLQKVHPTYFSGLNHVAFDVTTYLAAIQEYLIEVEGKKLARAYKKEVAEGQLVEEVIKVVLCLLLQGEQKGDFISRIVEMSVEVQTYLMEQIKKVRATLQNFVQIKDILSTVQRLEEENDSLKEKLKATAEANQQLSEHIAESKSEKKKIEKEIRMYENQKKQVFEQLQIVDLKEYVEIYRMMKQQNSQLNYCIQEMEDCRRDLEHQNSGMRDKINQDYHTISQLNDQVLNLKSNYVAMKEEISCLSTCYDPHQSFQDNVLRENKNFGNVKVRNSLESSCSDNYSLFLSHTFDEEENTENDRLRAYNMQIMHKLDNAYKTITNLTTEVSTLKEEKGKLTKKNMFFEKKLTELKKQQSRFMKELRSMGF